MLNKLSHDIFTTTYFSMILSHILCTVCSMYEISARFYQTVSTQLHYYTICLPFIPPYILYIHPVPLHPEPLMTKAATRSQKVDIYVPFSRLGSRISGGILWPPPPPTLWNCAARMIFNSFLQSVYLLNDTEHCIYWTFSDRKSVMMDTLLTGIRRCQYWFHWISARPWMLNIRHLMLILLL